MVDSNTDGRIRIYSVPSIANLAAPTTTELNAGTDLSALMTPDGLVGFEPDTGAVDNSKINSTFTTTSTGRAAYSGMLLRLIKQVGVDTVYNTLVPSYATNLVIRRDIAWATAWTSGDKVEVYPSQLGFVRNLAPEANAVHKYEVPVNITAQPNIYASVA
jgi:hypothetical protein